MGITLRKPAPSAMPAKSSPITAGWPRRSNASPANFPASSMIANTVKKRATSIPPAAPRTRSRPAAKAHGGGLKRLRRLGMEVEGGVEQRQIDALAVFGLDHDRPRRGAPRDPGLLGPGRKTDARGSGLGPPGDGGGGEGGGERGLGRRLVQQPVGRGAVPAAPDRRAVRGNRRG